MDQPERRAPLLTPARPSRGRAAALFIACGIVAALLTAWFQRICATRVSLDDSGAFSALLAVAAGVGVLGLGLQVVVGRLPVGATVPVKVSVALGAVVGVLVAVGMPVGGWYAASVGSLMAATTIATMCSVTPRARLLLRADWERLAVVVLVVGIVRVAVIGPLLTVFGRQLTAALAATALAEAAGAVAAMVLARRRRVGVVAPVLDRDAHRRLYTAVVVLAGLWGLTVVDSVIARLRLPAAEADAYSLATTVARASFFMALLLTQLALPTLMRTTGRSARTHDVLVTAASAIVLVAGAVALVVIAWPTWLATTVLGEDAAAVDVATLRLLAAAWAAMSVIPLLTYFHVDRHRRLAFTPFGGAVVLALIALTTRSSAGLAVATLVVFLGCALTLGLPAIQRVAPITRAVPWMGAARSGARPATIGMVVPFFNPGAAALVDTVGRLARTLDGTGASYRIVAVSDGSTDGSAVALAEASIRHVELVTLAVNAGKGAALRAGMARIGASGDAGLIGYIDADGDIPPEQVADLVRIAGASAADAVVASKLHPESVLDVRRHRSAMSALFRRATRLLFRLDVGDTQTGLKLYRADTIAAVGPLLREDGFAIDVEILVAARRDRTLSIVEAPVTIVASHATTVSWRRAVATAAGLGRIFWRDHVALVYEPVVAPPPSPATVRS